MFTSGTQSWQAHLPPAQADVTSSSRPLTLSLSCIGGLDLAEAVHAGSHYCGLRRNSAAPQLLGVAGKAAEQSPCRNRVVPSSKHRGSLRQRPLHPRPLSVVVSGVCHTIPLVISASNHPVQSYQFVSSPVHPPCAGRCCIKSNWCAVCAGDDGAPHRGVVAVPSVRQGSLAVHVPRSARGLAAAEQPRIRFGHQSRLFTRPGWYAEDSVCV